MSLVFLSLPLFPLLLSFSFFLLTYFFVLLADDGAVLVQAAICGPLDVSKQIAVDQLLAMRLQDMVGCPIIMGIGIDRFDSPPRPRRVALPRPALVVDVSPCGNGNVPNGNAVCSPGARRAPAGAYGGRLLASKHRSLLTLRLSASHAPILVLRRQIGA